MQQLEQVWENTNGGIINGRGPGREISSFVGGAIFLLTDGTKIRVDCDNSPSSCSCHASNGECNPEDFFVIGERLAPAVFDAKCGKDKSCVGLVEELKNQMDELPDDAFVLSTG